VLGERAQKKFRGPDHGDTRDKFSTEDGWGNKGKGFSLGAPTPGITRKWGTKNAWFVEEAKETAVGALPPARAKARALSEEKVLRKQGEAGNVGGPRTEQSLKKKTSRAKTGGTGGGGGKKGGGAEKKTPRTWKSGDKNVKQKCR